MTDAWIDYLGRSSYMLQQGQNVADVLVYYGEDTNIGDLYVGELPNIPGVMNTTSLIRMASSMTSRSAAVAS